MLIYCVLQYIVMYCGALLEILNAELTKISNLVMACFCL